LFQNLVEDGGEVIHGDDLSAINPLEEGWEKGSFKDGTYSFSFLASSLTAWGPPTSAKCRTARALVKTAASEDSILATESRPPGRARQGKNST